MSAVLQKEQRLIAKQVLRLTSAPKQAAPAFDQRTRSLLKLATNNPNENEARSAAVEACKRISKKLSG